MDRCIVEDLDCRSCDPLAQVVMQSVTSREVHVAIQPSRQILPQVHERHKTKALVVDIGEQIDVGAVSRFFAGERSVQLERRDPPPPDLIGVGAQDGEDLTLRHNAIIPRSSIGPGPKSLDLPLVPGSELFLFQSAISGKNATISPRQFRRKRLPAPNEGLWPRF
jgi:hypothetical protein